MDAKKKGLVGSDQTPDFMVTVLQFLLEIVFFYIQAKSGLTCRY